MSAANDLVPGSVKRSGKPPARGPKNPRKADLIKVVGQLTEQLKEEEAKLQKEEAGEL